MQLNEFIRKNAQRRCINAMPAGEDWWSYRHPDLANLCKIAHERGDKMFYYKSVNGSKYGPFVEGEPVYKYFINMELTEEEYNKLIGKTND